MSLPNWQRNGWLTIHKSSASEVRDLLGVVDRDLRDSAIDEISTDARLGMAYNAALKAGYRASRDQPHYRVIQSLALTIGTTAIEVGHLDAFRKKRNTSDYDRAGTTSEAEVAELRVLAASLRDRVLTWLAATHPELMNSTDKK